MLEALNMDPRAFRGCASGNPFSPSSISQMRESSQIQSIGFHSGFNTLDIRANREGPHQLTVIGCHVAFSTLDILNISNIFYYFSRTSEKRSIVLAHQLRTWPWLCTDGNRSEILTLLAFRCQLHIEVTYL